MLFIDMFEAFQTHPKNEALVSLNKFGVLVLNENNEWIPTEIEAADFAKYSVIGEVEAYDNGEELKEKADDLAVTIAPMWPLVEEVDKFIPSI